jgi:hypothetical protein
MQSYCYWLGQHWSITLVDRWGTRQTDDGYTVLESQRARIWSVAYLLHGEPPAQAVASYVKMGELPSSQIVRYADDSLVTHATIVHSSDGHHLFTLNAAGGEMLSLEFWADEPDLDWAFMAWRTLKYERRARKGGRKGRNGRNGDSRQSCWPEESE